MIKNVHIENFKCFKNFDIELGPFNVLIGPNDSGKTAFLQATYLAGADWPAYSCSLSSLRQCLNLHLDASIFRDCDIANTIRIVLSSGGPANLEVSTVQKEVLLRRAQTGADWDHSEVQIASVSKQLGVTAYFRFNPSSLRKPSDLFQRIHPSGEGFPTFLDDLHRASDGDAWANLQMAFRNRFPHYQSFHVDKRRSEMGAGFVITFKTVGMVELPPESVSDGVMLSLAYMGICHSPKPPGVLLIEEPENGVHYPSLKQTVDTLRNLNSKKNVQVILTTHSPYLLDLVDPSEVWIFSKDQEGAVHAKKMSDYRDIEDMKKHFNTGEIWTNLLPEIEAQKSESKE